VIPRDEGSTSGTKNNLSGRKFFLFF